MSLTYNEFATQIQDFVGRSNLLDDGWQLRELQGSPRSSYLYKKSYQQLPVIEQPCCDNQQYGKLIFTDPQEVNIDHEKHTVLVWEYNIAYNISYEVPALYFNVSRLGCASPLALDEVWNLCSKFGAIFDMSSKERWSTLTQQEHSVTRVPHFALHPCNTQNMMKQLIAGQNYRIENYLKTWLSTVAPVVGLRIQLAYHQPP